MNYNQIVVRQLRRPCLQWKVLWCTSQRQCLISRWEQYTWHTWEMSWQIKWRDIVCIHSHTSMEEDNIDPCQYLSTTIPFIIVRQHNKPFLLTSKDTSHQSDSVFLCMSWNRVVAVTFDFTHWCLPKWPIIYRRPITIRFLAIWLLYFNSCILEICCQWFNWNNGLVSNWQHARGRTSDVQIRKCHYNDVIMNALASQITSLTIVYLAVYLGADQRKRQSSASLAFARGIHRGPVNSPHKGPVTRKIFPFDGVIMLYGVTRPKWMEQNASDNVVIVTFRLTFKDIFRTC